MLFPRYYGRFFGLMPFVKDENDPDNIPERLWEVTLFQEADTPWELANLIFAADAPLTIEWDNAAPEDVIEGSTARAVIRISDGASIRPAGAGSFVRSRRAQVEELLLDTLVSQYDEPHILLSDLI